MKNGIIKLDVNDFQKFWEKKRATLQVNNPERFYRSLHKKIQERQTVDALDDYVLNLKTRKESTRRIIVAFYEYLNEKSQHSKIPSELYDKIFFDSPIERQLEIAKFIHEPRTMSEIEEEFQIKKRTLESDLLQLQLGIYVFGVKIQIEIKKEKIDGCEKVFNDPTLHPVFLPMNLTEVSAMTTHLNNITKDLDNVGAIENTSKRIKAQLSHYAFHKLYPNECQDDYINEYIPDDVFATDPEHTVEYLMKKEAFCPFLYKGKEYSGKIKFIDDKYKIVLNNGEILDTEIKNVIFLTERLNYK